MFFYSCPVCDCRVAAFFGENPPKVTQCPDCLTVLAFVKERRSLIDKIRDCFAPTDLINVLEE